MVLDLGGFDKTWRSKWSVFNPLILREVFLAFYKNHLIAFKCEHMKRLGGFCK